MLRHSNGTFVDSYERWSAEKPPKHIIPLCLSPFIDDGEELYFLPCPFPAGHQGAPDIGPMGPLRY